METSPNAARDCAREDCDKPIPADADSRRVYCSDRCSAIVRKRRYRERLTGQARERDYERSPARAAESRRRSRQRRARQRVARTRSRLDRSGRRVVRLETELADTLSALSRATRRAERSEAVTAQVVSAACEMAQVIHALYQGRGFAGWDGPVRDLVSAYLPGEQWASWLARQHAGTVSAHDGDNAAALLDRLAAGGTAQGW